MSAYMVESSSAARVSRPTPTAEATNGSLHRRSGRRPAGYRASTTLTSSSAGSQSPEASHADQAAGLEGVLPEEAAYEPSAFGTVPLHPTTRNSQPSGLRGRSHARTAPVRAHESPAKPSSDTIFETRSPDVAPAACMRSPT